MDYPGEKIVLKMWETLIEKGIGSLLEPWQTIRQGKAAIEVRRGEMLMLAQAERDVDDVRAGRKVLNSEGRLVGVDYDSEISHHAGRPLGRVEPVLGLEQAVAKIDASDAADKVRREINTSKAIIYAEQELLTDNNPQSSEKIEDDWLTIWKDYSSRVSTEDLQRLWGSVLAGEIKAPGKYSLRTLEFLKVLSKKEAALISKVAPFVIGGVIPRESFDYLWNQGVTFGQLMHLQTIGVLQGLDSLGLEKKYVSAKQDRFAVVLNSHGRCLLVEHEDSQKSFSLEVCAVTHVGAQLIELGKFKHDEAYLRERGIHLLAQGYKVSICDWEQVTESQGACINQEIITVSSHDN